MLLRRVTEHVRAQNWAAVVIDFIIVVVGVFIGIQVANWNETRADRRLEAEIRENIAFDLNRDQVALRQGVAFATASIEAGNYALAAANAEAIGEIVLPMPNVDISQNITIQAPRENIDATRSEHLWTHLLFRDFPVRSDTAFSALMSTGRLGLLSDESLVRDLQDYQRDWNGLENSQDRTFRSLRDHTLFQGQNYGLAPFTPTAESEYVRLLRDHADLRGAVRTFVAYTALHRDQMMRLLDSSEILSSRVSQL